MDVCYINPFLYALSNCFQSMLGAKVDFGKPSIKRTDDYRADVSGAIEFSGDASGAVVFALDRKSTRLNSSHIQKSRMPSSA